MRCRFFLAALFVLQSICIASAYTTAVSANGDLNIPAQEISSLQNQALQGSGPAALKLSIFYLFVKYDNAQGMYWTTIAAENGDLKGMYSLGVYLSQKKADQGAAIRAQFWLERAKAAGDPSAAQVLLEMNKEKH